MWCDVSASLFETADVLVQEKVLSVEKAQGLGDCFN